MPKKGHLNAGLRRWIAQHRRKRRGRGFIGDIWQGVKNLFKPSDSGESNLDKYIKKAKSISSAIGYEPLERFTKKAADIGERVGRYGKQAVDVGESMGYGRHR